MAGQCDDPRVFSEQDMKQRAGACHDEYGFSARLGLDPVAEGMPVLRYQTVATRFPAGVSRFEDSLAQGPAEEEGPAHRAGPGMQLHAAVPLQ